MEPSRSREYKIFQEEESYSRLPKTFYERACQKAEKILHIECDTKSKQKIQDQIDFAHLRVTPNGVASLPILFAFITCLPTLILVLINVFSVKIEILPGIVFSGISIGIGAVVMISVMPFIYYLYVYPSHLKRKYEMDTGSEIVTMILYMSMYMRNVPNLENALRFTSENIQGSLGTELKKLMWDIELGKYFSAEEALSDYAEKWKTNRHFVEAISILISSLSQTGERRTNLLDEAVGVILEGNREQSKHFNQELKMPVMIVHALGIVLPLMTLILFPIIAAFLGVGSFILFVLYDIILPIVLFFIISGIMEKRPSTFSKLDIIDSPDMPPPGKFKLGKSFVSAWIPSLLALIIPILGIVYWFITKDNILSSVAILGGVALCIAAYFLALSKQRMELRNTTRAVESEFAETLFQLSNQIGSGVPIELSIEKALKRIEQFRVKDLFNLALKNMRNFGMTFSQAFFDKEYGAIRYYPSRLIKSVMHAVAESSKKGVSTASLAMFSISNYLKNLHETQEDVKENLSDTLNSLKFQAYFLSPFISGIIVTMAIIIVGTLQKLSSQLSAPGFSNVPLTTFQNITIQPFEFIVVVGIYMIETTFILGGFINGIENGEDSIGKQYTIGNAIIVGFTVFVLSLFISLSIFGPIISGGI